MHGGLGRTGGERRGRAWVGAAVALVVALAAVGPAFRPAPAASAPAASEVVDPLTALPAEMLPPSWGQSGLHVWVEASKHTLRGQMLDYWRATGAASVYGNPISEPFASADGYYSQAFENGIFQFRPEYVYSEDPTVRLMPIGETALRERVGTFRADGRRGGGGGDRRPSAWRAVDPDGDSAARVLDRGGVYVEATGHTISDDFGAWYDAHQGAFYLGAPLSQPVRERGMTVQYFEGGLLMTRQGNRGGTRLAPLARELARPLGIQTKRVPRGDLPVFAEELFMEVPNPNPLGELDAPGRKRIEIDISQQRFKAYQGRTLITETPISTAAEPNRTERGLFHVRLKLEKEDMAGFTSSTGEVVGTVDGNSNTTSGQSTGLRYEVKDVPNVMYINLDAEAMHGAYWHNNFGTPMSHGCINLPLEMAKFVYGWAPLGTEVWVHE